MTSRGRCFQPDYKFAKKGVKYPSQTLSLSNSEPSVADFDLGDGSEPLVSGGMPPYCKMHMSTSAGNGLNAVDSPYSKWGGETFYRPLMSYRRVAPQHLQVFSAITVNGRVPLVVPSRKKDPEVLRDDVLPNAYMSVSDVLNSAKGSSGPSHNRDQGHSREQERCDLPGQLVEDSASDGSQQALLPSVSGYVPVEISYPELPDLSPEPETAPCDVDLSEMLPSNFAIHEHNCEAQEGQSNGLEDMVDNPDSPSIRIMSCHGGGRVFVNDNLSKDGACDQTDDWCALGAIQVDPDAYQDKSEVLTDQPITNGFSPFSTDISPARVISRPNLANVPVESV